MWISVVLNGGSVHALRVGLRLGSGSPCWTEGFTSCYVFMIFTKWKPLRTLSGVYPLHAGGVPRPQEQGFWSGSIGLWPLRVVIRGSPRNPHIIELMALISMSVCMYVCTYVCMYVYICPTIRPIRSQVLNFSFQCTRCSNQSLILSSTVVTVVSSNNVVSNALVCFDTTPCPAGFLQSEGGEWPLYVAAQHGHLDVMQKLEEVLLLFTSISWPMCKCCMQWM